MGPSVVLLLLGLQLSYTVFFYLPGIIHALYVITKLSPGFGT